MNKENSRKRVRELKKIRAALYEKGSELPKINRMSINTCDSDDLFDVYAQNRLSIFISEKKAEVGDLHE